MENAAKAVLAVIGPVPQTHEPRRELAALRSRFPDSPPDIMNALNALLTCSRQLGLREHVLVSYGDERARRTPFQIFDQAAAAASTRQW